MSHPPKLTLTVTRVLSSVWLLLAGAGLCPPEAAGAADPWQRLESGIRVVPTGTEDAVTVALSLSRLAGPGEQSTAATTTVAPSGSVPAGSHVRICFRADRRGFVTLWSYGADGKVDRVYPNSWTEGGRARIALAVEAGRETCIGDRDKFRLRVDDLPGPTSLYLHWTAEEEANLPEQAYVDVDALTSGIRRESAGVRFQNTWFKFEIVR